MEGFNSKYQGKVSKPFQNYDELVRQVSDGDIISTVDGFYGVFIGQIGENVPHVVTADHENRMYMPLQEILANHKKVIINNLMDQYYKQDSVGMRNRIKLKSVYTNLEYALYLRYSDYTPNRYFEHFSLKKESKTKTTYFSELNSESDFKYFLKQCQPGDTIEFKSIGAYEHSTIYIGKAFVYRDTIMEHPLVHFTSESTVLIEEFKSHVNGRRCRINNKEDSSWISRIVIKRAINALDDYTTPYCVVSNNCEHFVTYCRTNYKYSDQVANTAANGVGVAVAFSIAALGALLLRR